MRILTLGNLYPPDVMGGYEIVCAQAVEGLRGRGHDVQVLTSSPRLPVPVAPGVHRTLKLTEDRYWVSPPDAPEDALLLQRDIESRLINAHNVHSLIDMIQRFAPEVVYVCNLVGIGGLGLMACLQYLGVPWVWQLGDRIPFDVCSARGRLVPALAQEFSRGIHGHFIAVSRQLAETFESDGIRLNGPVEIVPNWITGSRGTPRRARPSGATLRIMSCGRVHREKGVDVLIEAARLLLDDGRDDFRIDVFGDVVDPSIDPLIRRRDLSRHVALMGPRPHREVLELYAEYDLFAFPTREHEPFGLVPLEALAKGCVPVISRRCGIAEWLVHGVHCLKAARNAPAFADVFARVLDGALALEPIARRGEEAVWRDFHIDAVLPRIENALRDASHRPRTAAGSSSDAYRLARLADGLARTFVQEELYAGANGAPSEFDRT